MENDKLTLGTRFHIDFCKLANNQESYTVAQLITALEATTTLSHLWVLGRHCSSRIEDEVIHETPSYIHRYVVEPLCRCIANLRLPNGHHPLEAVEFYHIDSDIIRQFLVAMKQFGIRQVSIISAVKPFSANFFVEFCRDNSNLKVLTLDTITFNDEVSVTMWPNDPSGDSSTLNLEKFSLDQIKFETSIAANHFAHLVSHLSVSALKLGTLQDEDYCEFKMPSVEHLALHCVSEIKHLQAALDAGMSTVTRLEVHLVRYNDTTERLTRMIRGAVKLNSLAIYTRGDKHLSPPHQLFEALKACASVTKIRVGNDGYWRAFTEPEVWQLRQITVRNSRLGRFVASPSTFPKAKLLSLMLQLNESPTGLYMLTRRLPEAFSFAKGSRLFPLIVDPNHEKFAQEKKSFVLYKY